MTTTEELLKQPQLAKRILTGAGIGLVLIAAFLLTAGEPNPEWHTFWRIKPLIIVPLAGAFGGIFYHLMEQVREQGGWKKIAAHIICAMVFLIALWMGSVLGLNGTYWN